MLVMTTPASIEITGADEGEFRGQDEGEFRGQTPKNPYKHAKRGNLGDRPLKIPLKIP